MKFCDQKPGPTTRQLIVGDLAPGDVFERSDRRYGGERYMRLGTSKFDSLKAATSDYAIPVVRLSGYTATYMSHTISVVKLEGCFEITDRTTTKEELK
jgi:hypothetical protein